MNQQRDFGVWLRQLRVAADMTQEALAEAIGCATQTLRAFESGRRRPSREMVARLAEYFQLTPSDREVFVRLARLPVAPAELPAVVETTTPLAPKNLPLPADVLIGRHTELQRLRHALLDTHARLVTLLGPGGVGKTRLALQAAADLAGSFADGVAFAALASVNSSANAVIAIAAALGCVIPPGQQPEVVLLDYLRERELLLVLDNLEQLLSAQGDQIGALLAQVLREAPNVYLLVTSRERLRLQAEWVVELHGLGLPVDDRLESITRSDSVLLFVERARRTDGDFLLTTHNQAIVAQICRRLDGLPLALELAAAQVSFLPPALLLARLDQALPLLEGGPRDVPERQRTMRAAISWSHNLLDARERLVFERLAVFAGGFDLEAVEAVVAGGPILQSQVLGVVRRLVDQSLVVREGSHGDHARYRLLEPVRQYALECLENQPEEASVIRRRHAAYFVALAETANSFMRGPEQVHWIERLTDEYPNLCATMTWLLAQKDLTTAAHFGYMLWLFLWMRNHLGEGLRWTEQVLSHLPNSPSIARGEALLTTCVLLYGQANYARAMPLAEECLEQYRILDDPIGIALGVTMVGLTAAGLGLYEKATQFIEKGVALHLAVGDTWSAAMALSYWAPIVLSQGQYCRAAALAEQALQLARTRGDRIGAYSAHYNLALVAQAEDNTSSAQEHFCEALALAVEMGDEGNIASCLKGLGSLAASGGEHVYAAQLWGAAETLLDTHGAAVYAYTLDRALYERMLSTARACTDPRVWDAAWAKGRAMPLGEAVAIAQHIDVSADALSVWK